MEPSLDTLPGLLEGLSLGDLSWVVSADTHNVGAGEDEDIGDKLQRKKSSTRNSRTRQAWILEPCPTLVLQTPKSRAPGSHLSILTSNKQRPNVANTGLGEVKFNLSHFLMSPNT